MNEFEDLYEPTSDAYYQALLNDIEAHGQREPIYRIEDTDTIVAGFTRLRIVQQLGREPRIVDIAADEAYQRAITSNPQRKMRKEARDQVIRGLASEGRSARDIAGLLAISPTTVTDVLAVSCPDWTPDEQATGRDKKKHPRSRPTTEQRAHRSKFTEAYWMLGYTRDAICEALGVSHGTVSEDLKFCGYADPKSVERVAAARADVPPKVDWHDLSTQPPKWGTPKRKPPAERKPEATTDERITRVHPVLERIREQAEPDRWVQSIALSFMRARMDNDQGHACDLAELIAYALTVFTQMQVVATDETHCAAVAAGDRRPDQIPPRSRLKLA